MTSEGWPSEGASKEIVARYDAAREAGWYGISAMEIEEVIRRHAVEPAVRPLVEALEGVKQCCLFEEDNGQIGVTENPCIPSPLFDEICAALEPWRHLLDKSGE